MAGMAERALFEGRDVDRPHLEHESGTALVVLHTVVAGPELPAGIPLLPAGPSQPLEPVGIGDPFGRPSITTSRPSLYSLFPLVRATRGCRRG